MGKLVTIIIKIFRIDKSTINNFNDFVIQPFIMSLYSRRIRHYFLRKKNGGIRQRIFCV